MLQKQVRDAHAAQRDIEVKLEAEQQVTRKYRDDAVQLREKVSSQDLEIIRLQSQLLKAERERDEVLSGKAAAEESHRATIATVDATLFDFYMHCVLGRGSLSFLGPEYEVTLAEVWEAIIDLFGGAGYSETDLQATYLSESDRAALAKGKEQLIRVRAEATGEKLPEKETSPIAPVYTSALARADIAGS